MKLHTVIISWQGQEENAQHIASCVSEHTDYLSVVYSNARNETQTGPGDWHKVPNDWFYGKKFHKALQLNQGDVHLQIQADAHSEHWPNVLRLCKHAFQSIPDVGVWTTETDYTHWETTHVALNPLPTHKQFLQVAQTDGIVWAFSKPVLNRLAQFNYEANNLGWGMDWAAVAYAYSHSLLVLRDTSVHISHPKGSGYSGNEAQVQMNEFLEQLTPQEAATLKLLERWIDSTKQRNKQPKGLNKLLKRKVSH